MSQFVMVRPTRELQLPPSVRLYVIDPGEDFLVSVAREQFGSEQGCLMLADAEGRAEPLLDDVHDAQAAGRDVADTALARIAGTLIDRGDGFICWHASDARDLPLVHSWEGFLRELRDQTKAQPADFWVRFSSRDETGRRS